MTFSANLPLAADQKLPGKAIESRDLKLIVAPTNYMYESIDEFASSRAKYVRCKTGLLFLADLVVDSVLADLVVVCQFDKVTLHA